jgi:hypothetical protein
LQCTGPSFTLQRWVRRALPWRGSLDIKKNKKIKIKDKRKKKKGKRKRGENPN